MFSLRQRIASALILCVGSVSILGGLSGCEAQKKAPEPFVALPVLQQVGLRSVWNRQLGFTEGERVQHVARVNDSIYITTNEARLIRIDMASGVKLWDISIGSAPTQFHVPSEMGDGKKLLLASKGRLYILDKQSGRVEVVQTVDVAILTDPVVVGNTICLGGVNNFFGLYADFEGRKWTTPGPGDVYSVTPTVVGNSILLASNSGILSRINADDGTWIWKDRRTNGHIAGGLANDNHAVYAPSSDKYLYAFDLARGGELWEARLDGELDQKPIALPGTVLVPSTNKGLYGVATAQGDVKWFVPGVTTVAAMTGDRIWAGGSHGELKAISVSDGRVMQTTTVPGATFFVSNPKGDLVIVLNKSGVLGAYESN